MKKLYLIEGGNKIQETVYETDKFSKHMIQKIFASCHTVKEINGELLGD